MYKKRAMGWWILYFECCAESLSSGSISSKISNYKDTPMCKLWWLTSHYTRLFDILCLVPHAVQVFLKESDESQKKTAFKFATTTMRNVKVTHCWWISFTSHWPPFFELYNKSFVHLLLYLSDFYLTVGCKDI